MSRLAIVVALLSFIGCGARTAGPGQPTTGTNPRAHPHAVEPIAGNVAPTNDGAAASEGGTPVGDPNAHAPPLAQVRRQLRLQLIAVHKSNAAYINPLRYVTSWGRTDQGVDAAMPVGAPILAPSRVKILAIIPDWFPPQPLVYFELLEGPDAGRVQYVAEQITSIASPGSILQQGQPIARYAASGTYIEYGWSTLNGVTLAKATTGYQEGQVTPAGLSIRAWLNSLGANAGNG
jgi:hypothetical protein